MAAPPGLPRRQRFPLNRNPWNLIPGIVIIAVLAGFVLWSVLYAPDAATTLGPFTVPSFPAARWILAAIATAMIALCLFGVLRLMQGLDRVQHIDLEAHRLSASGMGILRREVVIRYEDISRIERVRVGPGWTILVRARGGKLDLSELLFENRDEFLRCHTLLVVAVGGVDRRGRSYLLMQRKGRA